MRNLPQGVDSSFLDGYARVWNPHKPKSDRFKELFALLDFRPESQILVMTISTIYIRIIAQSHFRLPLGVPKPFLRIGRPPRYNYGMQSIDFIHGLEFNYSTGVTITHFRVLADLGEFQNLCGNCGP